MLMSNFPVNSVLSTTVRPRSRESIGINRSIVTPTPLNSLGCMNKPPHPSAGGLPGSGGGGPLDGPSGVQPPSFDSVRRGPSFPSFFAVTNA
jgi:hypothetical protein